MTVCVFAGCEVTPSGAIVLEALLGALADPLPGSPIVLLTLMLSLVVVTVAGTYSDWVGGHMETRMLSSWGDRWRGLASDARRRSWILAPLLVPGTFFGLEIIGLLSHTGAYALAPGNASYRSTDDSMRTNRWRCWRTRFESITFAGGYGP